MDDVLEVGRRIREQRELAELTQEELGTALGLNKSTIQRYETGKIARIKLPVLEAIAEELGINPEYLSLTTDDPVDYENDEEYLNAPLDVLAAFDGDPKKVVDFQRTVANDATADAALAAHLGLDPFEFQQLVSVYQRLNPNGRKIAIDRLNEMTEIEKYTNSEEA